MYTGNDIKMNSFCCTGSSRRLLNHETVKFTAINELPFEDSRQKSSPAVASPFLQTDDMSLKDDTFAMDSSWEEDDDVMNYTLTSDLPVSEAGAQDAVTGAGQEGVVDAAADISKFPLKNDL